VGEGIFRRRSRFIVGELFVINHRTARFEQLVFSGRELSEGVKIARVLKGGLIEGSNGLIYRYQQVIHEEYGERVSRLSIGTLERVNHVSRLAHVDHVSVMSFSNCRGFVLQAIF